MSPVSRPSFGVPLGRIALRRVAVPRASSPVFALFEQTAERARRARVEPPPRPAAHRVA